MRRLLVNPRIWLAAAAVAVLVAVVLWPETLPVDVGIVARGPLVVTIDEDGETRVRETFVVSSPVAGRVQRIEVDPGDTVTAGQVLTRARPEVPPLLDARTRAEIRAGIESATAAVERARAEQQQATTALAHARREHQRTRDLVDGGLATRQELDAREAEMRSADDAADAALHAVEVAQSELRRAQARLAPAPADAAGRPVAVTAPVAGVVLRRLRESESLVPGGEPLLHIGDPARLEIVSDLLSTDAVRVVAGARVLVDEWGGDGALEARVRRVEPSGFTKVSALGVEEQRVNVICDFVDPRRAWAALGDAYRVEVRIVLWESGNVLVVPTSALFRDGEAWAVYVVRDGRAHSTPVTLGQRTAQAAEVRDGLAEGDAVVLYPGDALADGVRVARRAPR
jgi:HlyD family secretion protein